MIRRRDRGRAEVCQDARVTERQFPDGRLVIYVPGEDVAGNTEEWLAGRSVDRRAVR
jgi:hypothetical protein